MKTQWKRLMSGIVGAVLCLPLASVALAQDAADDNRPRAERQNDDGDRNEAAAPERNARDASPSDLAPTPLEQNAAPVQPIPMSHARTYAAQGNCCCSTAGVAYSQNNGYRSARGANYGGYRSYSYQGGDDAAVMPQAAPAPAYYYGGNVSGRRYSGVQNGANWDRFNEHDSRNFSGSYGSRASLRSH